MSDMLRTFELLTELENTSSKNAKLEIIKKGEENVTFLTLVEHAYNPFIKFYISNYGKVDPMVGKEPNEANFNHFLTILHALSMRELTGNEALNTVKLFFSTLSEEEYKWFSRTLKKDLKVGATESTFNKVFGKDFIPTFECMLAKSWDDVKKKPSTVYVEPKLDGYRALCFVEDNGTVTLYTRNGKMIEGFTAIEEELTQLPWGMVYDGEITGKENAFNDMQKNVFKKGKTDKEGILNVFDVLPINEFMEGKSSDHLADRKEYLDYIFIDLELKHIQPVEFSGPMKPNSPTVDELYSLYLEQGYEGIMVKDATSKYECKRTNSWAKIKPSDTFDLEVIDAVEGEGKYQGKLGAFVVSFKGFPVNVGSGYSDSQREEFWKNKGSLVGKTIEVEAQETSSNDKGGESLRFPVFKGFRHDK